MREEFAFWLGADENQDYLRLTTQTVLEGEDVRCQKKQIHVGDRESVVACRMELWMWASGGYVAEDELLFQVRINRGLSTEFRGHC